jgi:hypothetical protein
MMRLLYLSLLFTTLVCRLHGQQAELDSIQRRFKDHRETFLQEKIYVHVDRPHYVTGETMWFKIYYTDGVRHRPLQLSRVCYLEVIDELGTSVLQTKVRIQKGGGSGSLFIPATMSAGNYTVRAYTNWMKNNSADYFFHTTITIINPFRTPDVGRPASAKQPDAQFFPEGGNLVAGLKSKVAFRVINESGKGIEFKGALLSSANDTLTHFKPLRAGIGNFSFTPAAGQTYRAVVTTPGGKSYSYNLPAIREKGYVLEVSHRNETTITIRSNDTDAVYAYLFIHTRQMIQKVQTVFLKNGEATLTLNKNELPEGTTHITLFDAARRPVAERLLFKKPAAQAKLEVKADQAAYDIRRKGNLELEVKNNHAQSDLSVAIYRLDSLPPVIQDDITSYFWLTSDLNGTIESPEYYLTSTDETVEEATDNLMLTHGWRRFTWEKVLNRKTTATFIPELRGHVIHAEVIDHNNTPASGIASYLTAPGKVVRVYGSRSDETGKTFYETIDFFGPNKVYLQTNLRRDSTFSLRVISPFSDEATTRKLPSLYLPAMFEDVILERSVGMQVQDIYPNEKFNKISNALRDSTAFFGTADETYYLDDYTRFPVMEEVMREYVRGVLVRKRRDGFHFVLPDKLNDGRLRDDPFILLDGFPVWDADVIMKFDPLKVRKLEVVNRIYYLGSMFFPGLVSYSTYQGDLGGLEPDRRVVMVDYEGLQYGREYYSPVYDDKASRQSRLPDQRSLIYWNPDVKLNAAEKTTLPFYTSDMKGKFLVVVKGLSDDGQPLSTSTSFEVRRFDY